VSDDGVARPAERVDDASGQLRQGALSRDVQCHNSHWTWLAQNTNRENRRGSLQDVLKGADVFIGVSAPGILQPEWIGTMARDPIVFAMANPTPEVMPDVAAPYVAVIGTGRSDFPNQINNLLSFPGIFRGALDVRARKITEGMKLAAARAIAAEWSIRSPDALRRAKRLWEESWTMDRGRSLLLEEQLQRELFGTPNQLEALQAGLARKTPSFGDPL